MKMKNQLYEQKAEELSSVVIWGGMIFLCHLIKVPVKICRKGYFYLSIFEAQYFVCVYLISVLNVVLFDFY